jgi:mannosyltransferase OCH1-like enzyme
VIPKLVHVAWNYKEVLKSNHPLIQNGIYNLIKLNPDWNVNVYTSEEVEYELRDLLNKKTYDLVKKRHIVSKIDLWRHFKMYFTGGLYIDIDRMVNIPLSDIITDNIDWVLPSMEDYDFSFDIMLSAPNNPVFKDAFTLHLKRLSEGWENVYFLGPQTYMHCVSNIICGEMINTNPGVEKFNMMREKISQISFMKTYREVPFNDMVLYRGNLGNKLEMFKRDFYKKEGVRHWTGEW